MRKKLFPNSIHWNKEVGELYTHVVLDSRDTCYISSDLLSVHTRHAKYFYI